MDDAFVPILSTARAYHSKHQKVFRHFYSLQPGFSSVSTDTVIDVSPINGLQNCYDTPAHGSKGRKIENDVQVLRLT